MTSTFKDLGINRSFNFSKPASALKQNADASNPFIGIKNGPDQDIFVNSKSLVNKIPAPNKNLLSFLGKVIKDISNSIKTKDDKTQVTLYRKDLVSKLITELNQAESNELEATISLLGKLKEKEAIPHLIKILENKELQPSVAKEIIKALSNFNNFNAYEAIIDVLNNEKIDSELRAAAAESLGNINNRRASKPLFDALNNTKNDNIIRVQAVLSLSKFPSLRNNEELVTALTDISPEVRAASAKSLSIIKHKTASESIISLLSDTNNNVVCSAIDALGEMKAPEASTKLIELLKSDNTTIVAKTLKALRDLDCNCQNQLLDSLNGSISDMQKSNVIKAIGILGYKELIPQLINIAKESNQKPEIKKDAISCLSRLDAQDARELFEATAIDLNNDPHTRKHAIMGLAKLAKKESLEPLLAIFKSDSSEETRIETLKAFRNIAKNEPEAVKNNINELLQELKSNNKKAKGIVIDIIGVTKAKEQSNVLIDILNNSDDADLRGMSAKIIGELEIKEAKDSLYEILLYEPHSSLTTQVAISLHSLGEKSNLYNLLKDEKSTKSAKSSIISGLITLGDDSPEIKQYMRPGLNVAAIHKSGITGKEVQIAVIDKPVDITHPEFEDRVIIKTLAHGTQVAGNAAGKTTGVAPAATILSYDAFNDNSIELDKIIEKIVEEKLEGKNNVKIINLSLGFEAKLYNNRSVMKDVKNCEKAIKLANKAGISVVIAAGNEGMDPKVTKDNIGTMNLLARNENAIVVGATDTNGTPDFMDDDKRAPFSSYPLTNSIKQIDIMAPGMKIELPCPGGSYKVVNGTSFATPFVSGLIALMYEVNPDLTPDQIKSIMNSNAMKLKAVPSYKQGNGEVIPYKAVIEALKLKDPEKAAKLALEIENNIQK